MLYYAYRGSENQVEAICNGCYAFVHFPTHLDYSAAKTVRQGRSLQALFISGQYTKESGSRQILSHEYTHKLLLSSSRTGAILNGFYWLARNRFIKNRSTRLLKEYYRMRTVYFIHTLSIHEYIVEYVEKAISSKRNHADSLRKWTQKQSDSFALYGSHDQDPSLMDSNILPVLLEGTQRQMFDADIRILKDWKTISKRHSSQYDSRYLPLGREMADHFAYLLSYKSEEGEHVHEVWGDYKGTDDKDSQILMYHCNAPRALGHPYSELLNRADHTLAIATKTALHAPDQFDTCIRWFICGQKTQYEEFTRRSSFCKNAYLQNILLPALSFIEEWAGVPIELRIPLFEFAEDTLLYGQRKLMSKWKPTLLEWKEEPSTRRFFEFFTKPGN